MNTQKNPKSFFYGWVIVALSFTDLALVCGGTYSLASALFISGGGALMLMPYYDPGILTVFYVVLFGIGYGAGNPIGLSIAADLFQSKHLGSILGILGLGIGVGFSLGPWLAGWLYDLNGGYHLAFTLALLANLISVVAVWAASPRKVRAVSRTV
jgi:MFS family permease